MTDDSLSKAEQGLSESPQFIHLRVHSAYSLLEGALPVKKIIAKAVADDQPALGLTDTNNLFAALEFSKTASGEGLQPIIDTGRAGPRGAAGGRPARPVSPRTGGVILDEEDEEESLGALGKALKEALKEVGDDDLLGADDED